MTTKPIGVLCVALGVGSRSPGAADIIAHLEANPGMAWEVIKDLAPRVAGPERWEEDIDDGTTVVHCRDTLAVVPSKLRRFTETLDNGVRVYSWDDGRCFYPVKTSAEARAAADAALVEAGYILCEGEDQCDS